MLEYFESINLEEIERYISDGQEENVNLEFKTVNHPNYNNGNDKDDRKNISKVLAGFANSNGGIIIWGIKASQNQSGQDVAKDKKPINQLTKFLNTLNRLEGQAVTPQISGIKHEKIDLGDDIGFVKTYVPQSDSAPHMSNMADKKYYKRSGDSFYECEHYDIMDMVSRKKSPSLKLALTQMEVQEIHQTWFRYMFLISIRNESPVIAKLPYLAINMSRGYEKYEFGLDGNRNTGLYLVKNNIHFRLNYIGKNEIVIYPGAELSVDRIFTQIDKNLTPPSLSVDYMLSAENMETISGTISIDNTTFSKN